MRPLQTLAAGWKVFVTCADYMRRSTFRDAFARMASMVYSHPGWIGIQLRSTWHDGLLHNGG